MAVFPPLAMVHYYRSNLQEHYRSDLQQQQVRAEKPEGDGIFLQLEQVQYELEAKALKGVLTLSNGCL